MRLLVLPLAMAACVTPAGPQSGDDTKNDDPTHLKVLKEIDVGGEADWMGIGFGSLWAPIPSGELLRIDPESLAIVARIPVGAAPYRGVAIGSDAVYIPNTGDDTISKVDPTTNTVIATFPATLGGDSEGSIGVSPGSLWVVTDDGVLSRLDSTTGAVLATANIPGDSHSVVVDSGCAWVTSFSNNAVAQVDVATAATLNTITVDAEPRFLTAGGGSVWVLSQGTGKVTRIDAGTGAAVATIDVHAPGPGGDIDFGEGGVWVTTFGKPAAKIDTATNELAVQFVEDGFGDAIRAGLGKLWISGPAIFAIAVP
jgi:virginiamycin B lyase